MQWHERRAARGRRTKIQGYDSDNSDPGPDSSDEEEEEEEDDNGEGGEDEDEEEDPEDMTEEELDEAVRGVGAHVPDRFYNRFLNPSSAWLGQVFSMAQQLALSTAVRFSSNPDNYAILLAMFAWLGVLSSKVPVCPEHRDKPMPFTFINAAAFRTRDAASLYFKAKFGASGTQKQQKRAAKVTKYKEVKKQLHQAHSKTKYLNSKKGKALRQHLRFRYRYVHASTRLRSVLHDTYNCLKGPRRPMYAHVSLPG